jgi:hypothetical protein
LVNHMPTSAITCGHCSTWRAHPSWAQADDLVLVETFRIKGMPCCPHVPLPSSSQRPTGSITERVHNYLSGHNIHAELLTTYLWVQGRHWKRDAAILTWLLSLSCSVHAGHQATPTQGTVILACNQCHMRSTMTCFAGSQAQPHQHKIQCLVQTPCAPVSMRSNPFPLLPPVRNGKWWFI